MKLTWLSRDVGGNVIQTMPLRKGFVNLANPATVDSPRIVYCVADGTITLSWREGGTDDIAMVAGDSFAIDNCSSLLVASGTFHALGKSVS